MYMFHNPRCDDATTYDGILLALNLNSEMNDKLQNKMEPKLFNQLCEVVYNCVVGRSSDMRKQWKIRSNALLVPQTKMKYVDRDAFTACTDANMWIMLIGFNNMVFREEMVDKIIAVLKQIPKYTELQKILLINDDQHTIYDWCQFGTYSKLTQQILHENDGKVILSCNSYYETDAAF